MSTQVTLTIPDNIYQQVEEAARTTNRRVSEVITETLERSFLARRTQEERTVGINEEPYPPVEHITSMDKEIAAYERIHAQLWEKYAHQFVAIYQGQIIDYDYDEQTLFNRLDLDYPYPKHVVLVRKVTPELPKPLYIRSPRFVRG
jgi:hypothetical protein